MDKLPEGDKRLESILIGSEMIQQRVEELACQIRDDYGVMTPLCIIGALKGATIFITDLVRALSRVGKQEISLAFARETKKLHSTPADTSRLRSYRQVLIDFYKEKNLVPEEYKQRALAFLERVPDTTTCLHGDLQIGNIITDGEKTIWIDVGEFSYGIPEWDLSVLWTICNQMGGDRAENLFHVTPEMLKKHWNIFLPAYLGSTDPQVLGDYTRRLIPFYAVKVPYVYDMAYHGPLPEQSIQKIMPALGVK